MHGGVGDLSDLRRVFSRTLAGGCIADPGRAFLGEGSLKMGRVSFFCPQGQTPIAMRLFHFSAVTSSSKDLGYQSPLLPHPWLESWNLR